MEILAAPGDDDAQAEAHPPPPKKRREFGKADKGPLDSQISDYISVLENGGFAEGVNPFEFWELNRERFKRIFGAAVRMLAIPGTSAPVERMFSQAGLTSGGGP